MSFSIHWTHDAVTSFDQNIAYLKQDWPISVAHEFLDRVDEILEGIRANPHLYPLHRPKHRIHKCVVHPRIILYYKIIDNATIDLLLFWNTWKDPKRLKI